MPLDEATGVHYEVYGEGAPLFLGFPVMASQGEILGEAGEAILRGFLERLTDAYRVLVVDYPSIGKSRSIPPDELTADRARADLLGVAGAAGFDRFAWWGYSWGAAAGLQLASRTDRLSALVIGGWPPLDAPQAEILRATLTNVENPPEYARVVLREPAQYRQWVTFWRSLQGWPETAATTRCPRMVFFGEEGDVEPGGVQVPIASRIRSHRGELEAMGWRVVELIGHGHGAGLQPEVIVPIVRDFLDPAILDRSRD